MDTYTKELIIDRLEFLPTHSTTAIQIPLIQRNIKGSINGTLYKQKLDILCNEEFTRLYVPPSAGALDAPPTEKLHKVNKTKMIGTAFDVLKENLTPPLEQLVLHMLLSNNTKNKLNWHSRIFQFFSTTNFLSDWPLLSHFK